MARLVLWDIDHTLINSGIGVHADQRDQPVVVLGGQGRPRERRRGVRGSAGPAGAVDQPSRRHRRRRPPMPDENLLTACQRLGTHQDIEVRKRIASGRRLTRQLRAHVSFMIEMMRTRQLAKSSAAAYLTSRQDMRLQAQVRAEIAAVLDGEEP